MTGVKIEKKSKRIAIIGGGWSGLYALKASLSDGHQAKIFEKDDDIGGIWRYRENEPGGVWQSVHAVSSKTFLHASDFPMPDGYPSFPHHTQIQTYLKSYANHFNLWPHIHLNHTVSNVVKQDGQWLVSVGTNLNENQTLTFDAVIICLGQTQKPVFPDEKYYNRFSGMTMHSYEYKQPTEAMRNKTILIIGGGDSASEIASEVSGVANLVYMSVRGGQWFAERHAGANLPQDLRYSRKVSLFISNYGNSLTAKLFENIAALSFGYGGHGLEEWRPTVPILNGPLTKGREVLRFILYGKVIPRKGVVDIEGNQVWFHQCEEPANIDFIIFATGYRRHIPFLPDSMLTAAYKHVFNPQDPTLAYVGTVLPVFGSVPALAELQARWVSSVFAGICKLPSQDEMLLQRDKDFARSKKLFPATYERLPQLVSHFEYADFIMEQLGMRPNMLHLFFSDNKKWRYLMNAPWTPFEMLLKDPEKGLEAYENIKKVYALKKSSPYPSLFIFMVIIIVSMVMAGFSLIYFIVQLLINFFA